MATQEGLQTEQQIRQQTGQTEQSGSLPKQTIQQTLDVGVVSAPRVSVVVVSYNTGSVLYHSLASVLDDPQVAEVVLVNNGNPLEVEEELQRWSQQEPRLSVRTGHGNVGFSRGCNLGAAGAQGEYLLFLNPDCVLAEGGVSRLVSQAQELPVETIISPLIVNPDGSEQRGSRRQVLTPWRAVVEWFHLYRLAPKHPYFRRFNLHDTRTPEVLSDVDVTSGAAMLMRSDYFRTLGGFDQRFFMHVEDIDLCVRVLKQGGQNYVLPDVRATHYVSSSRVSQLKVEWYKTRGFQIYFSKHFREVYPKGFVALVNAAVVARFLVRIPALVLRRTQEAPAFPPRQASRPLRTG